MAWYDWPTYTTECQRDMAALLAKGGSLSAYKANPEYGVGPAEGSWAWDVERKLEVMHDVKHAIVCSNGTTALTTLLSVVCQGKRVVTTTLTFSATVAAIMDAGLLPEFADVTLPSLHILPRCKLGRTRAVLSVDLFGKQSPRLANEPADSCQAIGLEPVAQHGVWSFNGRKQVPAGEGGAIYTQDDEVAERCRLLINHQENFGALKPSLNGRMSEPVALLVWHGLHVLADRQSQRLRCAERLNMILARSDRLTVPRLANHALYIYPLIVDSRMLTLAYRLRALGVECQPGYIDPTLDFYPAFAHLPKAPLPVTHSLSRDRLILFPQVTPTATLDEMDQLGEQILSALCYC